jgi:hypothetical protein
MAKYISNRQQNLKIGIVSYTENQTVLEVTGNVGIGTITPSDPLDVNGNIRIRSGLKDFYGNIGVGGSILISTGAGVSWTAPFTQGIGGIAVLFNDINIGTGITSLNFSGTGISSVTSNISGISTITVDLQSNLDGGTPTTNYGGIDSIEGGGI